MFKIMGAVAMFGIVAGLGSEWRPEPHNLANVVLASFGAMLFGVMFGEAVDRLRRISDR